MISQQVLDIYSDRESDATKFILPADFGCKKWIALTRLVIKWNRTSVDKEIFGKIEAVIKYVKGSKPEQLFTFTKAKKSTITDIYVANPIYYHRFYKDLHSHHPHVARKVSWNFQVGSFV